jgi:hypothetical protein
VPCWRASCSISANTVGRGAVQVAGGLVGQHAGRLRDQGARDGHALALAARQLGRAVLGALGQTHLRQHPRGLLRGLPAIRRRIRSGMATLSSA